VVRIVVVDDQEVPVMDGIEVTSLIMAAAGPKVLMLTTFDLDEHVYDALRRAG
jgi:DNA-binding NarL/FixJ family response regulator